MKPSADSVTFWILERWDQASVLSSLGMSANGTNMEAFREPKVLWWVLLIILFQEKNSLGGCRSSTRAKSSLLACLQTQYPLRPSGSPFLWWIMLRTCSLCNHVLNYYFWRDFERILIMPNHNTSDSDIEAFRKSKVLLGSCWWSAPPCNPQDNFLELGQEISTLV